MTMLKNFIISVLDNIYYAMYVRLSAYDGEYEDVHGRDESEPEGWTADDEEAYRSCAL